MTGLLEIHNYTESGYQPLVDFNCWRVALLNWEPLFSLDNAGEIERHLETDEVFILWRGTGLIFVSDGERLQVEEMQLGVVYNVPQGIWHNLLASRDASWIIVENRDTDMHNSEIRQMTPAEWDQLRAALPSWVKGIS